MGKRKDKALTDASIAKALKNMDRDISLSDGGGLKLTAHYPTGKPTWRMLYVLNGKDQRATLGTYPEMSIAQARAACAKARKATATKSAAPVVAAQPKPAAPQASVTTASPALLVSVMAAAGAALELVERMGFEWNGKRWIHGSGMP